jgi:hypothetical protein
MPNDYLRPLLIGLLATAGTVALGRCLGRWLPTSVNGKTGADLLRENGRIIRVANASLLFGLAVGLVMYKLMRFPANDPRPLGLAVGIALVAPMAVLRVGALYLGRNAAEIVGAYALYQKLPPGVLYTLTGLGITALVLTLMAILNP